MAKFAGPENQCIISKKFGADLHHVKSRGSGGNDEECNLMPLAHKYHTEVETIGLKTFAEKYFAVRMWLIAKGWSFDGEKWKNPAATKPLTRIFHPLG